MKNRCKWVGESELMISYHDNEWGKVLHDDQKLFEFIVLEGAQAGLSWMTILKRREGYRRVFENYEINKISMYDESKFNLILQDEGIIRNRQKVHSVIQNAKAFLKTQNEFGSFDKYIWSFTPDKKPIKNAWKNDSDIPARTELSDQISGDMKKRGFGFFGSTICYAHMQATGMVNDHIVSCFRYNQV